MFEGRAYSLVFALYLKALALVSATLQYIIWSDVFKKIKNVIKFLLA